MRKYKGKNYKNLNAAQTTKNTNTGTQQIVSSINPMQVYSKFVNMKENDHNKLLSNPIRTKISFLMYMYDQTCPMTP